MKRVLRGIGIVLFFIVLWLFGGIAYGQTVTPTGATNQMTYQRGGYAADSLLAIPYRDTTATVWTSFRLGGRLTVRPQDSQFYYHNGQKWTAITGTGSTTYTAGYGLTLTGTEFKTDTTVIVSKAFLTSRLSFYYTKTQIDSIITASGWITPSVLHDSLNTKVTKGGDSPADTLFIGTLNGKPVKIFSDNGNYIVIDEYHSLTVVGDTVGHVVLQSKRQTTDGQQVAHFEVIDARDTVLGRLRWVKTNDFGRDGYWVFSTGQGTTQIDRFKVTPDGVTVIGTATFEGRIKSNILPRGTSSYNLVVRNPADSFHYSYTTPDSLLLPYALQQSLVDTAAALRGDAISQPLGRIFYDEFYRYSLGVDYTSTLPVATISFPDSTYLQAVKSSSTTTFGDYITRVESTGLQRSTMTIKFIVVDKTSTSNGIAIGYKGLAGSGRDLIAQFSAASSGATAGEINLYSNTASGIGVNIFASSSALTFSAGDTLQGEIVRNDTSVIVTYTNLTTSASVTVSHAYDLTSTLNTPQLPSISNINLYFLGGTQKILEWEYLSDEYTNNDLFVINSIGTGYSASRFMDRFTNVIYPNRNSYTMDGGPGDDALSVLPALPEIRKHKPKNVYLCIGTNDALQSTNTTTFNTRVDSIIRYIRYTGINVIIVSAFPTTSDASAYNTKLSTLATTYNTPYVDVWSFLKGAGTGLKTEYDCGDGIHPNTAGHAKAAERIRNAPINIPFDRSNIDLANKFVKTNGNYLGTFMTIATMDNNELYFGTNGAQRGVILATGEWGMPNAVTNVGLTVNSSTSNTPTLQANNSGNGGASIIAVNSTGTNAGQFRIKESNIERMWIGKINGTSDFGIANLFYSSNNFGFQVKSDGSLLFMDAATGVNAFTVSAAGIGYFRTSITNDAPDNSSASYKILVEENTSHRYENIAASTFEPAIAATTSADYYRGDKTFQTLNKAAVGLGNVDNTSDATKDAATATLTNKSISGSTNTFTNIPGSAIAIAGTPNGAKFLRDDFSWQAIAGSGTVTSVDISLPTWLSVTGNPITTSGTLAVAAATGQTQNRVLASPDGSSGAVSLRALVAADIPTLNQNTTGSAATLTTTRTIWGQNFNGSANVTGDITLGSGNITMTGSLAATGNRVLKGWFTDIESTNAPTVGGVVVPTISSTNTLTNKTIAYGSNTITGLPVEIGVAISDETTAITTGTAKVTIRMPHAMTVTAVRASVNTVSSSGTPTVDINEAGTTILSTKLTIDANEKTSVTAATAPVISDASLADDAEITFDIDVAGTGAKGLKVWIIGTR